MLACPCGRAVWLKCDGKTGRKMGKTERKWKNMGAERAGDGRGRDFSYTGCIKFTQERAENFVRIIRNF